MTSSTRLRNQTTIKTAKQCLEPVDWCAYCTRKGFDGRDPDGKQWHIDHVEPLARGGRDALENLVKACSRCNLSKGTSMWWPTIYLTAADVQELSFYDSESIASPDDFYWRQRRRENRNRAFVGTVQLSELLRHL